MVSIIILAITFIIFKFKKNPSIREAEVVTIQSCGNFTYETANIRVIDGDTIECDIRMPLGIIIRRTIRAKDYDCCESRRIRRTVERTEKEIEIGKKAKELMQKIVNEYPIRLDIDSKTDVYGIASSSNNITSAICLVEILN